MAKDTVFGILWVGGVFVASKVMIFISTLILVRLLAPEDFGLLSLGLATISCVERIGDLGVGSALIQRRGDLGRSIHVAFAISTTMGLTLAALMAGAAPLLADFFGNERLTDVIRVLALTLLIGGLGNVPISLLKRELEFRRRFVPEVVKAITKGGMSILLAALGFGVWSLVYGHLAGMVAGTALYWIILKWRPRFVLDRTIARQLLGFGIHIMLVGCLGAILKNVDVLMVGRMLDASQIGFYGVALMLPELVVYQLCYMVSQTVFCTYSKLQDDLSALRTGYFATLRHISLITVPASLGLALSAPDFIALLYPAAWQPTVPVMQVLSIAALISALSFNTSDVFAASGRPNWITRIQVLHLALSGPILWLVTPHGIVAVAVAQAGVISVMMLVTLVMGMRLLGHGPLALVEALTPAAIGGATMTLACLLVIRGLGDAPTIVRLVLTVVTGVAVYLGVIRLVYPSLFATIAALFAPRSAKKAGASA
ncbi:lipopolysaccharide biosynthesis protein [Azospirillum sp. sgz302134]